MNRQEVKERIEEYRSHPQESDTDGLSLVEAVLFVKDVFGLLISEEEISHRLS